MLRWSKLGRKASAGKRRYTTTTLQELEERIRLLEIKVSWLMKVHDKLNKELTNNDKERHSDISAGCRP